MNRIYFKLAEIRGVSPKSEEAQTAISEWYDFLNKMGSYSLEAFAGLHNVRRRRTLHEKHRPIWRRSCRVHAGCDGGVCGEKKVIKNKGVKLPEGLLNCYVILGQLEMLFNQS